MQTSKGKAHINNVNNNQKISTIEEHTLILKIQLNNWLVQAKVQ